MNIFTHRGFVVAMFDDHDTPDEMNERIIKTLGEGENLVWVNVDGTPDDYIPEAPECCLVENYKCSLINSLLWDGHLTDSQQDRRILEMIDEFIDNGTQFLLEEYEFVEDEPFYDYSGGRD